MSDEKQKVMILHLGTDLMMASSIGLVARQQQLGFRSLTTADRLIDAIGTSEKPIAIINMQLPGLDIGLLGTRLAELDRDSVTVVWFAQHVYEDLIQAGTDTGIGTVMTRGHLSKKLPEVVTAWIDSRN